jgi:putative ABC transport system permease protein
MLVARRNLLQEKIRLGLSVGGVALAVMLILLLNGFLTGLYRQITSYLDRSPGSIIVSQEGVGNLLGATSLLPAGVSEKARQVEGSGEVVPILSQFIILDLHGKKQPGYLVGYEPEQGGGPWQIAEGREPRADDEMVFDRVLAERHDMGLGDEVEIMGKDFTVVGLSDGTTSWMTSFVFLRKSAAESLLGVPQGTSFLLVTPAGRSAEVVRDGLDALPGVDALRKTEMAANDLRLFATFFSLPLQLMVGIAFLVGTLVVGLVIYTATVERQREYGVLKAVGSRNGLLYRVVVLQALFAAVPGVGLGVALGYASSVLIMAVRPQFLVVLEPRDVFRAVGLGVIMALAAALLPARTMARLEPAKVFRR